jgi:UDP-N-acetylmuramoyl-L-alanyl-D-glutamate--2,6-diaminopimelate ligase
MARIACLASDRVILTSDNPRSEDADAIIEEMMLGVEPQNYKKVLKITNREEAIKTAISLSNTGDVILVAGKGHETYQEINGVRHPFDDKEILTKNLKLIKD